MYQSDIQIGVICLFKPSTCLVSNGSWEFTFATMNGNSRTPILDFIEIANSLAERNAIQVILLRKSLQPSLRLMQLKSPVFRETFCTMLNYDVRIGHTISVV